MTALTIDGQPLEAEWSFSSSADTVASVSDGGLITANGEGQATILIVATALDRAFEQEVTVNVVPYLNVQFFANGNRLENNQLLLPINEEVTVTAQGTFDGAIDDTIKVLYSCDSDNLQIVKVDDLTHIFKAVGAVNNVVMVSVSKGDTVVSQTFTARNVISESTVSEELLIDSSKVSGEVYSLAVSNANEVTSLKKLSADGEPVEIEFTKNAQNGSVDFALSSLSVGEGNVLIIETALEKITYANVTVATMTISTHEDLMQFVGLYQAGAVNGYYVLAKDVEYQKSSNADWIMPSNSNSYTFNGTFNGRGHKISNVSTIRGLFPVNKGVIKNLALTDVYVHGDYQGAGLSLYNYGTVSNCFVELTGVHMRDGTATASLGAMVCWSYASSVIENCIVKADEYTVTTTRHNPDGNGYVDFDGVVPFAFICYRAEDTNIISNCYVITDEEGVSWNETANMTAVNSNKYESLDAFIANVTLNDGVWSYNEDGLFLLGNRVFDNYVYTLELTKDSAVFEEDEIILSVGGSAILNASALLDGSVSNESLIEVSSSNESVASVGILDGSITVTAYEKGIANVSITSSLRSYEIIRTIKIMVGEKSSVSDEILIDLSAVTESLTISLPTTISVEEVSSISDVDSGKSLTVIGYDATANTLTLDASLISAGEKQWLIVNNDNDMFELTNVIVATKVIKNATDLAAFGAQLDNASTVGYYALDADIDFGSASLRTYNNATGNSFNGTFNGRGHMVYNVEARRGFFCVLGANAVVKNFALKVMLFGFEGAGGLAFELKEGGLIENCFVETEVRRKSDATSNVSGIVAYERGVIRNVVTATTYQGSYAADFGGVQAGKSAGSFNNLYAIGSFSKLDIYGTATAGENVGLYANNAAFFEGVTELSAENGWSSYWKLENGELSFGGNVVVLDKGITYKNDKTYYTFNNNLAQHSVKLDFLAEGETVTSVKMATGKTLAITAIDGGFSVAQSEFQWSGNHAFFIDGGFYIDVATTNATYRVLVAGSNAAILIIKSFAINPIKPSKEILFSFLWVFVFSMMAMLITFFVATIFFGKIKEEKKRKDVFVFISIFSNCGFVGIPFIDMFTDGNSQAMMYIVIFNAAFNVLLWTLGAYLITQDKSQISVKKAILNPCTITMLLK